MNINPLNAKLNPICYLLALLGAHHILHFSRVRVNVTYCDHYASCGLLMFILFCVLQPMVRAIQTYQVGVTLYYLMQSSYHIPAIYIYIYIYIYTTFMKMIVFYSGK